MVSRTLTMALVGVLVGALFAVPDSASAAPVSHGELAPEHPRTDVPKVVDGKVWAQARVGDNIVVAGSFTEIELPDGSIIDQPYIFAYDIFSGDFDEGFDPVLDDEIFALEPDPDGTGMYIGGSFKEVDGNSSLRIAKLHNSGEFDIRFSAQVDARVRAIAVDGSRV